MRLVVVGAEGVGKSALTVRYLTRRYIGEYRSGTDLLYRHNVCLDNVTNHVEILDVSVREKGGISPCHSRWGDGFAVVYSVCDINTLRDAIHILNTLQRHKASIDIPIVLLANKTDLHHARQVSTAEGEAISVKYNCMFMEVNASECHIGITMAFHSLIRHTRSIQYSPIATNSISLRQRRISIVAVSRILGSLIGRGSTESSSSLGPTLVIQNTSRKSSSYRIKTKKRPSLSL